MTTVAVPAPRKLPVWHTVGECYAVVARNLGQLVRLSWLWLLIMLPVYAGLLWLHWKWQQEDAFDYLYPLAFEWPVLGSIALDVWLNPFGQSLFLFVLFVVQWPFLASIAVAWHRLLLCRERVMAPAYLRLDGAVWRYVLYSFLLSLIATGGALLPLIITENSSLASMRVSERGDFGWLLHVGISYVETVIGLLVYAAIGLLVLPRLSLVLPAVSLGVRLSLKQAWRMSRGNTLRLALATLLCCLPAFAPMLAALLWAESYGTVDGAGYVVREVINSLSYAVLAIFAVTLLSLTYRLFSSQRAEGASPPA